MSQASVERLIGRLATDEGFRRRFTEDPTTALEEMVRCGCDFNSCERQALSQVDPDRLERFADTIDPRLQKAELSGGSA